MTTLMKYHPLHPSAEDAQLAHQARTDSEAFAELYRRHVTSVYRYHLAHTGDIKDAEDLTSQTFMAALENIRSYRGTGAYIAWLMGIASRKRALFFRRKKPDLPLDEATDLVFPQVASDHPASPRLQREGILRALRSLSPERAEALILCFFSELNAAEAGQVLGKSEAAVKMLVSRGLQDLRTRSSLATEMEYE